MRRRTFILGLGGAAASSGSWPLAARAQQAPAVVGFLRSAREDNLAKALAAAVRAGLGEAGYAEGKNLAIEYRYGDGQRDRLPALAAELIRKPVAAIVANSIAAFAAKTVTTTVPIVFVTGTDPVRDGLVTSFNRPGGNVTGVSFLSGQSGGKRLELLRRLVPGATTIAVLVDSSTSDGRAERHDIETAAQAVGQRLAVFGVSSDRELEAAFESVVERGAGALMIGTGAFFASREERLVALTLRHRLPASRNLREFALAGGLMAYGASITDAYRQGGIYAGRILKGEKPSDLPVLQSVKFELVLNLKTAKALGLEVPLELHAAADEVIE
jgi:putative ABC transport system substrate-binding protein